MGLLGPNGAGKTTTLLMVLGAVLPDEGTIHIAGFKLPRQRSKAMQHVGFAAGYLPLPDRLKVREALGVFAGWYGVRNHRKAVDDDARAVRHRPVRRPPVQLAVERSAHARRHRQGDAAQPRGCSCSTSRPRRSTPTSRSKVRNGLLEYCRDSGAALLVTSHDMREVEMLTERVMFLARGEVVANDTPAAIAELYGHDDLEGVFLELAETHGR